MILIYNPNCSKSRELREILDARGFTPRERDYLQAPLARTELGALQHQLGCDAIEMVRQKEDAFREQGLTRKSSEDAIFSAIEQDPTLLQRPIVIWHDRAVIARPPSIAFSLLPDRSFSVRPASFEALEQLVNRMLISPLDLDPSVYRHEWRDADIMLGCFDDDTGECVGSAMFFEQPFEGAPAWRLRAMAIDERYQGLGLGRSLLKRGAEAIRERQGGLDLMWCNAREHAAAFYRSAGWVVVSDRFDIEGVGPHYKMTKTMRP